MKNRLLLMIFTVIVMFNMLSTDTGGLVVNFIDSIVDGYDKAEKLEVQKELRKQEQTEKIEELRSKIEEDYEEYIHMVKKFQKVLDDNKGASDSETLYFEYQDIEGNWIDSEMTKRQITNALNGYSNSAKELMGMGIGKP